MAVTRDEVIVAYVSLQESGIEFPTRKDVLEYLGKGSMTTINKYLKQYLSNQVLVKGASRSQAKSVIEDKGSLHSVHDFMAFIVSLDARIKALEKEVSRLNGIQDPPQSQNKDNASRSTGNVTQEANGTGDTVKSLPAKTDRGGDQEIKKSRTL